MLSKKEMLSKIMLSKKEIIKLKVPKTLGRISGIVL